MGGRTKPGFSRRHPKAGRRHSAEHPRAKAHPSLDEVAKITCVSEREGEKKQDSDVLYSCKLPSCGLGGLHGASHSWEQWVTQQASQASKHTRSSNGSRFCTCCDSELLWPEPITQEERMGCKLSRHVNHPPESVPALSQTCWSDMKRRTVNLYRLACQAFLFLKEKEKLLNVGIWFDEKE